MLPKEFIDEEKRSFQKPNATCWIRRSTRLIVRTLKVGTLIDFELGGFRWLNHYQRRRWISSYWNRKEQQWQVRTIDQYSHVVLMNRKMETVRKLVTMRSLIECLLIRIMFIMTTLLLMVHLWSWSNGQNLMSKYVWVLLFSFFPLSSFKRFHR